MVERSHITSPCMISRFVLKRKKGVTETATFDTEIGIFPFVQTQIVVQFKSRPNFPGFFWKMVNDRSLLETKRSQSPQSQ